MKDTFEKLIQQIPSVHHPVFGPLIQVFLIFAATALSWWIFNFVLKRVEGRYKEHPFFKDTIQFFSLIKKAGHYAILILAGIGVIRLIHIPILEKIFYDLAPRY